MSAMKWDQTGEKLYETGVDKVGLYPQVNGAYPAGVPWNGVTAINDSPSGAEATKLYADNKVYLTMMSNEELGLTIEAYMYPDEFAKCDGSLEVTPGVYLGQQSRQSFGLVYRSLIGNDTESTDYGYKLHLVWGCLASPSETDHSTVNESPEAATFSWEVNTTPVEVSVKVDGEAVKPVASMTINSTTVDATKLAALEEIIYGSADAEARLPLPDEVIELMGDSTVSG